MSVAIGNRAMASGLHTSDGRTEPVDVQQMILVRTMQGNTQISVITQETSTVAIDIDPSMYESFPTRTGKFTKIESSESVDDTGHTIITEKWQEGISGLLDPRYVPPEEWYMYDIYFDPGQGPDTHYSKATYGVAVGYRALAGAYHTLSLGHYARAYRPHAVAVGPSSHIKSEGGVGLGYYNSINAGSPFSLAIGSRVSIESGMTNAIVIGVPQVNYGKRLKPDYKESHFPQVYTTSPKAMKSNSINFVFNGNGLNDVFIDNIPLNDRLITDVEVIGNANVEQPITKERMGDMIRERLKLSSSQNPLVLYSGDGGIEIVTKSFLDELSEDLMEDPENVRENLGNVKDIRINGMTLQDIIQREVQSRTDEQAYAFRTNIRHRAEIAMDEILHSENLYDMKSALTNFMYQISR